MSSIELVTDLFTPHDPASRDIWAEKVNAQFEDIVTALVTVNWEQSPDGTWWRPSPQNSTADSTTALWVRAIPGSGGNTSPGNGPGTSINLQPYPSFESGAVLPIIGNGTGSYDTSWSLNGTHSLKILAGTSPNQYWNFGFVGLTAPYWGQPIVAGTTYTWSIYANLMTNATGRQMTLGGEFLNASGTSVGGPPSPNFGTLVSLVYNTPQRITCTMVAPTGAVYFAFGGAAQGTWATGDQINFDNMQLEAASSATTWVSNPTNITAGVPFDVNGVRVNTISVTPTTGTTSTSFTPTFQIETNKTVIFQDVCVSVRDANPTIAQANDNATLDFAHLVAAPLTVSTTTYGRTDAAQNFINPESLVAYVSYNINGVWYHDATQIALTVNAVTPPSAGSSPVGARGVFSGMKWASGAFNDCMGRGASTASYTAAEVAYGNARGNIPTDTEQTAQNSDNWGNLTDLNAVRLMNSPRIAICSLPPFPQGGSWLAAQRGDYDAYWQAIGAQVVALRGSTLRTVLRLGWEANGSWYYWEVGGNDATSIANYQAGWRRMAQQINAGAEAHTTGASAVITMSYSMSGLDGYSWGDPLTVLYPGNADVDLIGMDTYDDNGRVTSDPTNPAKAADFQRLYDFCKANGKWMAFDEWGLSYTHTPSGGDNPNYIHAMRAWMRSHQDILAYESYFQDVSNPVNTNGELFAPAVGGPNINPNSAAAEIAEMHNAANFA